MSLTDAWLVLIAGVSLVSHVEASAGLELNAATCNKKERGGTDLDKTAFGMRCFLAEECHGGGSHWEPNTIPDKLNSCEAMIAIRPSKNRWMVVLQLRGTTTNHRYGIDLYQNNEKLMNCRLDIETYVDATKSGDYIIESIRTSTDRDKLTLCEFWIETSRFSDLKDAFTGSLSLKWEKIPSTPKDSKVEKTQWDSKIFADTERCSLPRSDTTLISDGDGDFYLPLSIWDQELKCAAPNEVVHNVEKFKVKFRDQYNQAKVADRLKCNNAGGNFRYEVIELPSPLNPNPSSNFETVHRNNKELKALCVAKACSMCAQPDCTGDGCPKFDHDTTTECATLTCASGIYLVGDKLAALGTPTCVKTAKMSGKAHEKLRPTEKQSNGETVKWVEWQFNGEPATKFRCGKAIECRGDELKVEGDKEKTLEVTLFNATCKEQKQMRGKDANGDDLDLLRVDCDRTRGVWNQVNKTNATSPYVNTTKLVCYVPADTGAVVKGGAELAFIGGGIGGIAVIVIIAVIVWCCCCRRRRKKAADTKASMTAVSSGDLAKKTSEISLVKSAPRTVPSIPVSLENMKSPPPPPRSDAAPEPKKEETKKEFLKFDDSNISDIQQLSKKHEETERLDVLQQEAEKMSVEQKQKMEEKKKAERDLYPRLADIDDDWNNSEEKKIAKDADKKVVLPRQAPSDKTTVMSKLNSNGKPLQNAPHDDGQYEALGMPTVMAEKTAIEEKTTKEDESGTSKKSTKTRTKMQVADASEKKTELQTALDAKLADMEKIMEKTAILNEDEEGETQKGTQQTRTMMTGKTKATTLAGTQSKDRTTVGTTQGGVTGAGATTQRTRTQTRTRGDPTQATQTRTRGDPTQGTQTRTRGDPTQVPSFEGVTARDPTAGDETQMATDGVTAVAPSENDPTQLTDGRTGREVTANDVTQGTDGRTAQALTPVDFTQEGRTRNRTRTPTGRTALTKTRATRTQDQTTRTADQETQDPTMINDPTQILTRTRRTSRTQDGTNFDGTQDPTGFDQTQALTDGRTRRTRGPSRTQMTRTGTTQDQTGFDGTQDPTAFDQTQLTAGGRTRTSRTQETRTRFDGTQDPTAFDQTQAGTDGRTRRTRGASGTQMTRTGTTQDQTGFDGTQDPTAFDQTQGTGGTRTDRTRATMTGATQADPTRTGMTQAAAGSETEVGEPTQAPSTDGRTALTRTRARTTQDGTMAFDETQAQTDGQTAVSRTKGRTTQDGTMAFDGTQQPTDGKTAVSRTKGRTTQDGTMAFDGTQQPTDGRTAVSRTKGRTTQGETTAADGTQVLTDGRTAVSRTKARTTQDGTPAFDGTQQQTEGKTAVSRTKGRTTQGETTAADGTQLQTDGRTAVSRTKGRTTQGETTAADGTQLQTDGKTAVSRTKGRTTQDGTTAVNDGTQVQTEGQTAVSKTKGRTTQDGTTAVADGTQVQTDGRTAVSRTKGRTTQDGTTAVADGTQVQTDGRTAVSRTKGRSTQDGTTAVADGTQVQTDGRTAVSKTKGSRTQEPTTAATRAVTSRTQDQRTRTKSQSGTKTPNETQMDGQTNEPREQTKSRESQTGARTQTKSNTGAEGPQTQSKTGAEQPPSD